MKLNRILYGLKAVPKTWNDTFNNAALQNNLGQNMVAVSIVK